MGKKIRKGEKMNKWIIAIILVVILFGGVAFGVSRSGVNFTLGNGQTPNGRSDNP